MNILNRVFAYNRSKVEHWKVDYRQKGVLNFDRISKAILTYLRLRHTASKRNHSPSLNTKNKSDTKLGEHDKKNFIKNVEYVKWVILGI